MPRLSSGMPAPDCSEVDTALPDRGRRDAPKMGKRLAKRDVKPDLILSSPAQRALKTAEIIAKKLDYKLKDIVVDDRLYAGAVHDLLNVIHKLGDKLERVTPGPWRGSPGRGSSLGSRPRRASVLGWRLCWPLCRRGPSSTAGDGGYADRDEITSDSTCIYGGLHRPSRPLQRGRIISQRDACPV